ncbi:MAG: hypothetical protein HOK62_00645 [Verrucomicrobiales bacterium]|nr:hypothetical protein [Verrucomicrobiales bacterium]
MSNLAGQTDLEKVQIHLRAKLEAWMQAQGDEGVATELKAKERQGRGKPKKK